MFQSMPQLKVLPVQSADGINRSTDQVQPRHPRCVGRVYFRLFRTLLLPLSAVGARIQIFRLDPGQQRRQLVKRIGQVEAPLLLSLPLPFGLLGRWLRVVVPRRRIVIIKGRLCHASRSSACMRV